MRNTYLLVILLALASCASPDRPKEGKLTLGLADTALAGGAPRLALQVSQAVLAQHPGDIPALLRQGDAYYALGEFAKATESYDRVLESQPHSTDALLGLGRVALASDPAGAVSRFSQVVALDPQNEAARTDRGIAYDLLGRHAEAQADYQQVIVAGGEVTATKVDLGLSLAMSGDADAAVQILQPIASASDASARVRQDLAVALVLAGRNEEAERILLTQMSPDQVRAAIAAYAALRDRPLTPALLDNAS
jgi:Flp pilus assembly protein TadD